MYIKITALLSVFQLIIAENSANLLFADSGDLNENTNDDITIKMIKEGLGMLQPINENLRQKMIFLSAIFNEHLSKQRREIKEDLEELKAALTKEKKPSEPVKPEKLSHTSGQSTEKTYQSTCQALPRNCAEVLKETGRSGVYSIIVPDFKPFFVYCLKNNSIELKKDHNDNGTNIGNGTDNGNGTDSSQNGNGADNSKNTDAWMIIQRRQDGTINFWRKWTEYQVGFGNLEGEFFIGLDKLHAITQSTIHELWIQMEDFEGEKRWAKYSTFAIGGASESYTLNILGNYSGDAGDSLVLHAGQKWSTKDKDNDNATRNCALEFTGAWWYVDCHQSNLNGLYLKGKHTEVAKGISWYAWKGWYYSMKYVHMAIRPVSDIFRCT